jgi:chromosome segregation and condensation protein ScpB
MSLKPQLEAIIYAAETPISMDQIVSAGEGFC